MSWEEAEGEVGKEKSTRQILVCSEIVGEEEDVRIWKMYISQIEGRWRNRVRNKKDFKRAIM